jgi:putative metallohydrolase (TIGR04338 family)
MHANEDKPTSTRALAQYGAKRVRDAEHDRLGNSVTGRWMNPFSYDVETVEYRERVGRTGWTLKQYERYPRAEQVLRDLAETDPYCAKLVRLMEEVPSKMMRARISFHRHIYDTDPRVPHVKDPQKSRVYRSENKLGDPQWSTVDEARAFVFTVTSSELWVEHSGYGAERPTVSQRKGRTASSNSTRRTITFASPWSWTKSTALHELAHLLAPPDEWHGPLFTALHVMLVGQFMSETAADALREFYTDGGVKIATDATIAVLFDERTKLGYAKATKHHLESGELVEYKHKPLKRVARR